MSWVGIPIIMFVNYLHEYMRPDSFNTEHEDSLEKKHRLVMKEANREAIRERMKFFELTE